MGEKYYSLVTVTQKNGGHSQCVSERIASDSVADLYKNLGVSFVKEHSNGVVTVDTRRRSAERINPFQRVAEAIGSSIAKNVFGESERITITPVDIAQAPQLNDERPEA
jgi:hypothetical protein